MSRCGHIGKRMCACTACVRLSMSVSVACASMPQGMYLCLTHRFASALYSPRPSRPPQKRLNGKMRSTQACRLNRL
ncbi:hypothetical protein C8Q74DRAFT_1231351, partial [Fomes fomentarius]